MPGVIRYSAHPRTHSILRRSLAGLVLLSGVASCAPPGVRTVDGSPDAAAIYGRYCSGCHGPDGERGKPEMHLSAAASRSDEEVLAVIANGRAGMPPWKGKLKQDEIKAVAAYARDLGRRPGGR